MADETLNIRVRTQFDATGTASAKSALSALSGTIAGVSKGFASFGLVANGVKSFFSAIVAPIKGFISGIVTLSEEFEVLNRQTRRLETSMQDLPASQVQAQLRAIEMESIRTGIATDDLTELTATLNNALEDRANSTAFLQAILDTAVATESKNLTVLNAVKTATTGRTGALERLLPQQRDAIQATRDLNTAAEREAAILKILQDNYGGLRGAVNIGVTSIKTFKNSMGDIVEELGKAIFSNEDFQRTLLGLAIGFRAVVRNTAAVLEIFGRYFSSLLGLQQGQVNVAATAVGFIDVLGVMAKTVIWVSAGVKGLANLIEVILGAALVTLSGIVSAIIGTLQKVVAVVFKVLGETLNLIAEAPDFILDAFGTSTEAIKSSGDAALKTSADLEKSNEKLSASYSALVRGLEKDAADMMDPFVEAEISVGLLEQSLEKMKFEAIADAREFENLDKNIKNVSRGKDDVDSVSASMQLLNDIVTETEIAFRRTNTELSEMADTASGLVFTFSEVTDDRGWLAVTQAMRQARAELLAAKAEIDETESDLEGKRETAGIGGAARAIGGGMREATDEVKNSMDGMMSIMDAAGAQIEAQFGQLFQTIISGSQSFGDALLNSLLTVVSMLAQQFAKLFIGVAIGMTAAKALGPVGLFAAAAVLGLLAAGVASIMSGSEGGGAAAATEAAQTTAPVQRQIDQDAERGGRVTINFHGIATDSRQVQKALGRMMGEAESQGFWIPRRRSA